MVFPVVMYGCESWTVKKAEHRRIDAFELWCWRRLLRVPRAARRSNQSILKEISPGISLDRMMLKLKRQYLATSCKELTHWKRLWFWEGWGQKKKGTTVDEMARWHHWLDGRESGWTLGVGEGQGGLACCNSWGRKESDMTERLIWPDTVMCLVTHTYPTLCKPIDCSLPESSVCGDCPGKNKYWSGLLSLPLEIFSTQGSSPGLLYCTCIIYQLSYQGSPFIVNYIVSQKILFWHIPIWKEQYSPIWLANSQESKDYLK